MKTQEKPINKQDVIKIAEEAGLKTKIEHSVVIVYLKNYTQEEINNFKQKVDNYNGSIGFRPISNYSEVTPSE